MKLHFRLREGYMRLRNALMIKGVFYRKSLIMLLCIASQILFSFYPESNACSDQEDEYNNRCFAFLPSVDISAEPTAVSTLCFPIMLMRHDSHLSPQQYIRIVIVRTG